MNWKQIVASTGTDDSSLLADWFALIVLWAISSVLFLAILFGGLACVFLAVSALIK